MVRKLGLILSALVLMAALVLASPARAESVQLPLLEGSPYDLINAVNALRASNGLPAYSINSILMYTAQSHADFIAATGNVSHTGAGGLSVTDRLLAAGYPLAGDLSLGGFRSENITGGGESMPAQAAVDSWRGDASHLNTMLSPNLTEIGAGVAVANGRVYYVIDCARPTTDGAPQQGSTQSSGTGSTIPAGEAPIPLVVISTPDADGDIIHEVLAGQTLWQIAITYNVKVKEIQALNGIADTNIFPGEKLVIKRDQAVASATPVETATALPTISPTSTAISPPTALVSTSTATPGDFSSSSTNNTSIMTIVMGIIALALLGGGIFSWAGSWKKDGDAK